jgi:hypothetical protein
VASHLKERDQKRAVDAAELIRYADGSFSMSASAPGDVPIDPHARYFAKTLDENWFRSHPRRSHRLRRAIVGEEPGVTPETYIVLRQVRPGFRQRLIFKALVPLPEGDAPEHIAHAFFDLLLKYPNGMILADELFERIRAYAMRGETDNLSPNASRTVH